MDYKDFQAMIEDGVLTDWMEDGKVEVAEFYKNNGQKKAAVYIREAGALAAPAIYLDRYYDMYRDGYGLEDIISLIRAEYEIKVKMIPREIPDMDDYAKMKEKVIFRLVNYEKNRDLLQECPYIQVFDLAITFRWISASTREGMSSAMVTNRDIASWGISLEELMADAAANTRRMFPPVIKEMTALLAHMPTADPEQEHFLRDGEEAEDVWPERGKTLYVATTAQGVNGASALFYENLLSDFADYADSGFYILPSSIHELILVSEDIVEDPEDLFEMVSSCNSKVVLPGDLLSDSVYYLDKTSGSVRMLER